jgi:guanylate kinase
VPDQQFKLLQQAQQLQGVHQHMGHSYALPVAALEAAAHEGKAALVVGSVHLAEQLKHELPDDVQVGWGAHVGSALAMPWQRRHYTRRSS